MLIVTNTDLLRSYGRKIARHLCNLEPELHDLPLRDRSGHIPEGDAETIDLICYDLVGLMAVLHAPPSDFNQVSLDSCMALSQSALETIVATLHEIGDRIPDGCDTKRAFGVLLKQFEAVLRIEIEMFPVIDDDCTPNQIVCGA